MTEIKRTQWFHTQQHINLKTNAGWHTYREHKDRQNQTAHAQYTDRHNSDTHGTIKHSDAGKAKACWHICWDTHTHIHKYTQQVLTGSRPHSQNTDMQIGKLQKKREKREEVGEKGRTECKEEVGKRERERAPTKDIERLGAGGEEWTGRKKVKDSRR